jgi:N-acetylglucosaminyl-diphospho-decaprenol L-rhamnosyltransferase
VTLMRKHWSAPAVALGRGLMLLWSGLRLVGSRFVSGRRDDPGASQAKWQEVWRRRDEWLAGYDMPSRTAP